MSKRERTPRFEEALADLEGVVRRLEEGEMPLEESLEAFERGMKLVRTLSERLAAIEERVEVLLAESGELTAAPDDEDDD